jgi:hypothetical protein
MQVGFKKNNMIFLKGISVGDDATANDIASSFFKSIEAVNLLPFLEVASWPTRNRIARLGIAEELISSSIYVKGSLDFEDNGLNNIIEDSKYFEFLIEPELDFVFKKGMGVTIKLDSKSSRIEESSDFPKYTGTTDEVIRLLIDWIKSVS